MGRTLTQLTTTTRRLIQSTSTTILTDAIVQEQIQHAAREVYLRWNLLRSTENITIVAGTAEYTLTEVGYWYRLVDVEYNAKDIPEITEAQALLEFGSQWRTRTGTPLYYIRVDDDTLRFVPTPASVPTSSPHAKVYEYLYPAPLNDTTNTLIERYELPVCRLAASLLFLLDKTTPDGLVRSREWERLCERAMDELLPLSAQQSEAQMELTTQEPWY